MSPASPSFSTLSKNDRQLLESWVVEFDQGWDENRLAMQVSQLPVGSPLRIPAMTEMVKIDLERHWQLGRHLKIESYLEKYPELGGMDGADADLILAEFEVRQQFGAPVSLTDFARRFPRQAEELLRLIEHVKVTSEESQPTHGPESPSDTTPGPTGQAVSLPEQFGRYEILKKLGQGGMGSVYLAHDSQLDRKVALKVPAFKANDDPEILQRFYREARAAAALHHPNLCPVYDVGEILGIHFLTMECLKGQSLAELVKKSSPLPQAQAADLVRKMALALAEAHAHGVIHRDLKPSNVMINQRGEPVIMDFGLARRINTNDTRLTRSGAIVGTPAYMSPEQVEDENHVGPLSDVYSLGVLLYELLTGRTPYQGSMTSVLVQIARGQPLRPSFYRSDIDARLEAICLRAMAKKIEDRFGSMEELARALAEYLKHASTAKETVGAGQRNWRIGAGVAAAAIVFVVVSVALYVNSMRDPRPQPEAPDPKPQFLSNVPTGPIVLEGHTGAVSSVDFVRGGHVVSASAQDRTVRKWDVPARKELDASRVKLRSELESVPPLSFSPDGLRLLNLWRPNGDLDLLDVEKGSPVMTIPVGSPFVHSMAFAGNGRRFILGYTAIVGKDSSVAVWETETGKRVQRFVKHEQVPVQCVALSLDGKLAASAAEDGVRMWEVETGKQTLHLERPLVRNLAIAPDGMHLLTGEPTGVLVLWDATGKEVGLLKGHLSTITSLAFSSDGKRLLSGSADKTVRLWDVNLKKELAHFEGHTDDITCLAFSPDERWAVSGSKDQTVRLWSIAIQDKK